MSSVLATEKEEEVLPVRGGGDVVKYSPFSSTVEASFWTKLAELKLNTLRLSEDPTPIYGTYGPSDVSNNFKQPTRMRLDHCSLSCNTSRNEAITCRGTITIYNTLETFKRVDKQTLFQELRMKLLSSSNDEEEDLSYLSTFHCISFLDLKKYTTIYWFLFPALSPTAQPVRYFYSSASQSIRSLWTEICDDNDNYSKIQRSQQFSQAVHDMRIKNNTTNNSNNVPFSCPAFFMAINIFPTNSGDNNNSNTRNNLYCIPLSLKGFSTLSKQEQQNCAFCFLDPSSDEEHPGWPMRNLVSFLACKFSPELLSRDKPVHIIAYRPGSGMRRITATSTATNPTIQSSNTNIADATLLISIQLNTLQDYSCATTSIVGWELNARLKPGPRIVNLSSILDPSLLASQSVDLNLQLMKWRLLPNLDTELLKSNTNCLLLGAGTLGCNVARTLLGWGVRNLSIVDNGRVAHSNPVRQSLFESSDVGKFKATAAADCLLRIFPHVNAKGYILNIPMPGHSITTAGGLVEEAQESVKTLEHLIQSHDVIFLLTDTRESRWLPTVMAAAHDKLLINVALGLDSWLVMRHGVAISSNELSPSSDLGCYFCNDVVAPENSTKERTLDQQCTVTRPGLAPIAAAISVELMVALLHTKDKHRTMPSNNSSDLGVVPHQIRGFLRTYTLMTPTTPRFRCCTACSFPVINEYKSSGFGFVQRVCSGDASYLEDLTGLTEFKKCADGAEVEWDEDDDLSQDVDE